MKDFDYHFAALGEGFNIEFTAKELFIQKSHMKDIEEELRLENLTGEPLILEIEEHGLLLHPKKVSLKPREVKHIKIKIPCGKVKRVSKSFLVIRSASHEEKIPIRIEHYSSKDA